MRKKSPPKALDMLLRDQFALHALNGMISSMPLANRMKVNKRVWARVAYAFADSMLTVRIERNPQRKPR